MNITIIGAGAWGTALAISLAPKHQIVLWARDVEQVAQIAASRVNQRYLPEFSLPLSVSVQADLQAALASAELILVVAPTHAFRSLLRAIASCSPGIPLLWGCKGLEASSAKLLHQVAQEELKSSIPFGVLSGPSFAQEVAAGLPTALTLASTDNAFACDSAAQLHSPRLRIYTCDDLIGVEVGGAVKNVMAIAAGISDAMGYGYNARAALITRGLAEITRLGLALGGRLETFMGLTGMGDLILTCTGDLSRNRMVGQKLAQGLSLEKILRELGHTAEGVISAREVHRLAHGLHVEMPITQAVCRVLYEGMPAKAAVEGLLNREPKAENLGRDG